MFHTSLSASWLGLCPLLWVISLWSAAKTCHGSEHPPPHTHSVLHREQARTPAQKHCDALTYHNGALRSMRSECDGWAEPQAARCKPFPSPHGCQIKRPEHGWRLGVHRELAQIGLTHTRFGASRSWRFTFGFRSWTEWSQKVQLKSKCTEVSLILRFYPRSRCQDWRWWKSMSAMLERPVGTQPVA